MELQLKNEFTFTDNDFDTLRNIVTTETGIMLPPEKKTLMYSRLARRLRRLGLEDFGTYIHKIQKELKVNKTDELMKMVNAMTTNVTSFFREPHHFEHLSETLPKMYEQYGKVRIWSCAASTGEEPWSIAMTVADFIQKHPGADVKIIASDIDDKCIEKCEKGEYDLNPDEVAAHPKLKRYLMSTPTAVPISHFEKIERFTIKPEIRKLISFKPQNLLKPFTLPDTKYHIVFCRNVVIYFSKDTQKDLFHRIHKQMATNGILYIGHSESLMNVSTSFDGIGRTTYESI